MTFVTSRCLNSEQKHAVKSCNKEMFLLSIYHLDTHHSPVHLDIYNKDIIQSTPTNLR